MKNIMGGLSQLISIGAHDVFLTGDPQRSLWKRNSVRKTNFAIESQETVFDLLYGSPSVITIARKGDLIKSCVLQIKMMRSSINLPGETVGICCKVCKTKDMIDVAHKKCPCGKQPYIGFD